VPLISGSLVIALRVNQLPVSATIVEASVTDKFFNFYSVKNHKIAKLEL